MQWQILLVLFGTPTRITLVHEVLATLRAGLQHTDWGSCRPLFAWPALSPHGHGGPVTPLLSQLEERSRPCHGPSRLSEDAEARGNFEAGSWAGCRGRRFVPVLWPAAARRRDHAGSFGAPFSSRLAPNVDQGGCTRAPDTVTGRRSIICAGSSRKKAPSRQEEKEGTGPQPSWPGRLG